MSDEGKPLEPELVFKKVVWRNVLQISASLERSTTWTITGVAAIAALLVGKLDSLSEIVSTSGLRWGIVLFVVALIFGAISKLIGTGVANGLDSIFKIESTLFSPAGKELLNRLKTHPKEILLDIAEPFLWPFSLIVRRSGIRGTIDYAFSEKRLIRMFCFQIIMALLHGIAAAGALLIVAFSIK